MGMLKERDNYLARDQMVETLRSSFILPEIISKNIGSYNLEERSVNYFIVKASDQKLKILQI